jgi:hypothetical protein
MIKKLISTAIWVLIAVPATAQLQKGTITAGGSFSYNKQTDKGSKVLVDASIITETRQTAVRPVIGFFFV